jgi:isoleucyl-tRNA synthetase
MKLLGKFDAIKIEDEVRSYLQNIDHARLFKDGLGTESTLGYIEGPPTLNGEPHAGHLRGRIIKDMWFRFKTLQGYNVIFRAGWDTQGLPVELQAEKILGLTGSKSENIEKVGIDTIVATCKKLIEDNAKKWIDVDKLLGMSFDYSNAYWTYKDEYIEKEWKYLKKAWEKGILKEWFRVVAYCPSCETSLSNAEVNQGYKNVEDPSFYYKMKFSQEDAYLIIWTTMPFTLVTDELIGVNPDSTYCYVAVRDEVWIVGQNRLQPLMKELGIDNYEVIKTILGKDLEGKRYIHPLVQKIPGLKKLADENFIHYVVAEKLVDTSTGSGLVHLAPANGQEDFEIAAKRGLPIFVPIDDKVIFTEEAGSFRGIYVRDADELVIGAMREVGGSIKSGKITHQYPTCWRSGHKVVWLARREYFYMIDKLHDKPLYGASKVEYFFESPRNRFLEIIKEKVPWCITRERVWGTPIPIWKCGMCSNKEALFSKAEIISRATNISNGFDFELHRPWIDRIQIKCSKCGTIMLREPFVLDTWHNSGAAPYASLNNDEFMRLVPAAFMTEGIDQTRGWAYTLLIENVIIRETDEAPFKSFLFQGHILDKNGNKMSKSLGNVINAKELLTSNSVDLIRFYLLWKSSPIDSLSFNLTELSTRPYQVLSTLYNLHIYLHQNSEYDKFDKKNIDLAKIKASKSYGLMEKWINSRLQSLVSTVTTSYNTCKFNEGAKAIEEFVINSLSQVYVPFTRDDLWDDSSEYLERRRVIYSILAHTLRQIDILIHPLCPFISNYLYLVFFMTQKSILLESWPHAMEEDTDPSIDRNIEEVREIISLANSARMKAKIKRRWPISRATVILDNDEISYVAGLTDLMKTQLNTDRLSLELIPELKDKYSRINRLLQLGLINLSMRLKTKRIAPHLRNNLSKLVASFENERQNDILLGLTSFGKYSLKFDDSDFEITKDDVELSYSAAAGYAMAESEALQVMVFIETFRSEELITKGFVKDLARNLQQLRKEKGYLPTDLLSFASVSNLNESELAEIIKFKDDLAYLVRAKSVEFCQNKFDHLDYKEVEIDGRKVLISIK